MILGAKEALPGLTACNSKLSLGDTLVVRRLCRMCRSICHLVNMIEDWSERGIGFRSISDGMIETTSASGELEINIFSAVAQVERRPIQERTNAGMAATRDRGCVGGRRAEMGCNHPKVKLANKLFCDMSIPLDDIRNRLKISKSTLYRSVTTHRNRHVRG